MQKRQTFPGAGGNVFRVGGVLILLGLATVVALALSGRISVTTQTWETLVARLKQFLSSDEQDEQHDQAADAGASRGSAASALRRQSAPLSSAQLSAPLIHAPFISACGAPDEMKVVAEVRVKMGRATSVTVKSYPSDATVAACVERAIRDLQWDISPKTDHVTVTY